MHPILLKLGNFTIYSYGLFMVLGFSAGIVFVRHEVQKAGEDVEKAMDLICVITVAGIVGARLLYVLTNFHSFVQNPVEIFKFWNGGLVFYGGYIAAMIATYIW